MRRRAWEIVFATIIIIVGVIGVILQSGIFDGGLALNRCAQLSTIATVLYVVYELGSIAYMRRHKKGVFAAVLKYSVFVLFTFQFLFGQLLLRPYYADATGQLKMAYTLLHVVMPLLVYGEWFIGEKGHFYAKFLITASFVPILYCLLELIMGRYFGYAYKLIDVNSLGYYLVIGTMVILYVLYLGYGLLIVLLDHMMYRAGKK